MTRFNKSIKNKKAEISQQVIYYIPRIIFTIFLVVSPVVIIRSFIADKIDIREAETAVFSETLLYSKNGISYYNPEIDRIYPGIIDINNLEDIQKRMNKKLIFGKSAKIGARITYYFDEIENYPDPKKQKSIYYNEHQFNNLAPFEGLSGSGGSYINKKNLEVSYIYDYKTYPGKIMVEVAVPNG